MNLPKYQTQRTEEGLTFEFTSKGPKGDIKKRIQFSEYEEFPDPVYNLALGDVDPISSELRDDIRTNNGDSELVFSTVGSVVFEFCNYNPGSLVVAKGNTNAKNRLYQMQVAAHLKEIEEFLSFGD